MNELTREQWAEQRRNHLGASECAAVLGVDPNYGALSVWEKKVTGYSMEDNKVLRHGRLMEEPIAQFFAEDSGRRVEDPGSTLYQYHLKYPWLAATLDRYEWGSDAFPAPADGKGALEIKNIDIPGMSPDEWHPHSDELFKWVIQNQIQMACARLDWGTICGKFPYYDVCWFDHVRNDEFLEAIYPILADFWECVVSRTPPPVDTLPGTLAVCKRIWKKEEGTTIPLGYDDMVLINEWEKAKQQARKHDKEAKKLETKIRYMMKDNTFGTLPDGTVLSSKITKRKGHVVEPSEFKVLRRTRPKGI